MIRPSGGAGAFTGAYYAFKEECNRYAKQKLFHVNNNIKMMNMTYNETGMEQLSSESFESLLTDIDTFICGADGLLWLREGVILEASSLINILIENKKEVIILTNDTTTTRANHVQKTQRTQIQSKTHEGAIVAAVSKASNREAVFVGKPHRPVFDYIKKRWLIDETRTMMICSSINCDVKFGNTHGMRTLLIFNETVRLEDLEQVRLSGQNDMIPNYYATSISALLPNIK